MKIKYSVAFIAIVLCCRLYAQDSLWTSVKIDENLRVSIPKKIQQLDTVFNEGNQTVGYRIFKTETQVANLVITVTPNGTNINVDDEESLRSVLDSFERGTCKAFNEKGLSCEPKDSLIDNLPCKKIEAFVRISIRLS